MRQGAVPSRRATIKDVAQYASVGTMTVSRVVTGKGYVASETRQKVEKAIQALGYVPNGQARGLRSNRTGTIALVVSDITNPYFTTIARGVEDVARLNDSLLLIASSDESESEELRCMKLLAEKGVDGVIFVPSHVGTTALNYATEQSIPCVVVDRRGPAGFDCVRCDSSSGAADLANLLLSHGHRQAGILAGDEGISTSDDRVNGFLDRFRSGGGSAVVARGPLQVEVGQDLALELLKAHPSITCLFAVNNFLAIGALKGLAQLGRKAPDEISIVGFDDLPSSMLAFPFLTVVHQPARELGMVAAEHLFRRIKNTKLPVEEVIVPTTLIQRESVGTIG